MKLYKLFPVLLCMYGLSSCDTTLAGKPQEESGIVSIAFMGNGSDSGEMEMLEALPGLTLVLPECMFAREGFRFSGWNTNAKGTGDSYADSASIQTGYDDIVLYAQWIEMVSYAVGDLYPKNGTPQGIVFYVENDGLSGKIVSLETQRCSFACLYSAACTIGIINQLKENLSLTDGSDNYEVFCSIVPDAEGNSDYGAFFWCSLLGEGWYIPAKNELLQLKEKDEILTATISALRETDSSIKHISNYLWSSSVRGVVNNSTPVNFSLWVAQSASMICNEDNSYYARAIKKFGGE